MNKKGFTLIELLAVIVILAIIALIATPIVLNIIADSKENSQLRSAEMYLDAVEYAVADKVMDNKTMPNGLHTIMKNGNICIGTYSNKTCTGDIVEVEVNGETPKEGSTIIFEDGKIKIIKLLYGDKTIYLNSNGGVSYKAWTLTKASNNTSEKAEIGDIITMQSENFYVYSNENGYIKAIAKYNLEVGNSTNSSNPATIETNLQSRDKDRPTVQFSSDSNNYVEGYVNTYKTKLEEMGAVFVNNLNDVNDPDDHLLGSGVRLITLKELEDLGCNLSSYTGSCSEAPSFITETTYWTGSAGSSNDEVWCVDSKGSMSLPWVYVGGFAGVRPIITILESDI